jgi:hypothetical protein
MAVRGWGGSVAIAIGMAAGAGAAQLGLGYGLGIIAWLPSADGATEAAWVGSLAWATWIAATSTVTGAVCAERLSGPATGTPTVPAHTESTPVATALWRAALAVAAAVGALTTVALIAVPARAAVRADTFSPQTIAAGYAVVGVVLGLLVALWALASRAVAANLIATAGWLWLLAVVAVIDGVASGRGLGSAQPGVWQMTSDDDRFWFGNIYWPGAALAFAAALVVGALAALPASRRGDNRVGVAVSGALGPLLVAAAYFLASPRLVGIRGEQASAYLTAPYAVITGLAGSVLIAALAQRAQAAARRPAPSARPAPRRTPATAAGPAPDPADGAAVAHDDPSRSDHRHPPAPAFSAAPARAGAPGESARGQAAVQTPSWADEPTDDRATLSGRSRRGGGGASAAR